VEAEFTLDGMVRALEGVYLAALDARGLGTG
jgi:hypothetical protein